MLVDFRKLSRSNDALVVEVDRCHLKRCEAILADQEAQRPLVASISADALAGNYFIKLVLSGTLYLCCQRCIQAYPYQLQIEDAFVIVADPFDDKIDQFSSYEPLVRADHSRIDLYRLIEEEILLYLPAIPRHEDSHCQLDMAESAV